MGLLIVVGILRLDKHGDSVSKSLLIDINFASSRSLAWAYMVLHSLHRYFQLTKQKHYCTRILLYVALQTKIRLPPTQDFFEPMEN
jgi:hypothetical protein